MRIIRVLCDICQDEEVDEIHPGEILLAGHCDAGEPDRLDTFKSKEICSRCMRLLFETVGRMKPATAPGRSKLLQRIKPHL